MFFVVPSREQLFFPQGNDTFRVFDVATTTTLLKPALEANLNGSLEKFDLSFLRMITGVVRWNYIFKVEWLNGLIIMVAMRFEIKMETVTVHA